MTSTMLSSFVAGADDSLFPLQNLPYGVFRPKKGGAAHIGVAIGDQVLDLTQLEEKKLLQTGVSHPVFNTGSLNAFAAEGSEIWAGVRKQIQSLLSADNSTLRDNNALREAVLLPQQDVDMLLPFHIEGFSDFYASEHHATNVGMLFRGKENALLPNWKFLPVGYNGRASTVFPSGTAIPRPQGQIKLPTQDAPVYSPSQKLDFELEMGLFVGKGNPQGQRISVNEARSHYFGMVLLNDWSARDIQSFEYQPLGPFLSKSFATSISPWVVPMAALEPFLKAMPAQDPRPVDYLQQSSAQQPDIKLKVELQPKGSQTRTTLCETNFTELYWSMEQMLAHHTVNHCIMKPGDLLGSGTISGTSRESWGSLLEITFNGAQPVALKEGGERRFLEDGDTVIMTGYCENAQYKIGFGTLVGTVAGVR